MLSDAGIPDKIPYSPNAEVQDLLCYKYYNPQEVSFSIFLLQSLHRPVYV